jgi:hypothetical protein
MERSTNQLMSFSLMCVDTRLYGKKHFKKVVNRSLTINCGWVPPAIDIVKINTDAAFQESLGTGDGALFAVIMPMISALLLLDL